MPHAKLWKKTHWNTSFFVFFLHSIGPNLAKILPQSKDHTHFTLTLDDFQWNMLGDIYIYEQETSVSMCYTITVKQKTQHLFNKFFIIYTINVNINVLQSSSSEKDC